MCNIYSRLLTLPAPYILESCIKIKINLNFYFHTSLLCLKRFVKVLKAFIKPFEAPQRLGHQKDWGLGRKGLTKKLRDAVMRFKCLHSLLRTSISYLQNSYSQVFHITVPLKKLIKKILTLSSFSKI